MAGRSEFVPLNRKAWLLSIGQHLRAEYDALAEPVPPRLAALVKQLESTAQNGDAQAEGAAPAAEGNDPPQSDEGSGDQGQRPARCGLR